MSFDALQRTVRRSTAVLVAVLGLGLDDVSTGFDGTLLVLGALAYLLVSGFLGLARRYDERAGLVDDAPPGEGDADGESGVRSDPGG